MKRREFIGLFGAAAANWPLPLRAQTSPTVLRVGAASPTPRTSKYSFLRPFEQRMAELGYVAGNNFVLDFDNLQGKVDRYGEVMREFVRKKVDIILA